MNLTDAPEYTPNETYQIQANDPVEGAATGASYGGIGVSNQPHQQLANRTAYLWGRQNTNISNIAGLQAFAALFSGALTVGGQSFIKVGFTDSVRGLIDLILIFGFYNIGTTILVNDTLETVNFLTLPGGSSAGFPNAILCPPLLTNVYVKTSGSNTAASVVSWNNAGFTMVFDVVNTAREQTTGFSYLAIGF